MKSASFIFLFLLALACGGCYVRPAYFVSPYNGNQGTYHPMRLQSDSVKTAWYAGAAVAFGSANENGSDDVFAAHLAGSGNANFGAFQSFYSANFSAGNYRVAPYKYNEQAENKSFSALGLEGGINTVMPFEKGEWRVIGIEASFQNEFGQYWQFRKNLPEQAADLIVRDRHFLTMGGYTELMGRMHRLTAGFRLAGGTVLGRSYHYLNVNNTYNTDRLRYRYFSYTVHVTSNRATGFLATRIATKASGVLMGFSYRVSK